MLNWNEKCLWSVILSVTIIVLQIRAEDGYDLWLRYRHMDETLVNQYRPHVSSIVTQQPISPMILAAISELQRGFSGMLDTDVPITEVVTASSILVGTPATSDVIRQLALPLASLGTEGYVIRRTSLDGLTFIVIAGNTDQGVLYGSFEFLKLLQMHSSLDNVDISSAPKIQLRLLNHWDNLDGTVERGYAGNTVWDWWKLPDLVDVRYTDYSRACASIGINGVVVNNVNAKPDILTAMWLSKVAALSNVFRPYGIKIYLSVRFSTPWELSETSTADPLNSNVIAWWNAKVDEIYSSIPDFGGFIVKASSEGQPGPADYGRSHSEGANMIASALQRHGGVLMWRAFVYSQDDPDDRAKQAYTEFKPLDGQFANNVIIQVKNGAIDFQPREPFHPLFGQMPNTQISLEVQITKEYLGFATHLAYLGPMWEEVLTADTFAKGVGSTVDRVIDGTLFNHSLTAIAGVANVGTDRDWTGSHFNQANWYVYGRQAWDPTMSSRTIAEDWLRMTFSTDPLFVSTTADIMMRSREVVADYMTPLGLHHLMDTGHHYGPGPWASIVQRLEASEVADKFADPKTMDERYLLWFHHLPWDYQLQSGRSLWDGIVLTYGEGVDYVKEMSNIWASLKPYVDYDRYESVAINLRIQEREAKWWRDACIAYFQSISNRSLPAGAEPPGKTLAEYKALKFPYAPGSLTRVSVEVHCSPSSTSNFKPLSVLMSFCVLVVMSFIYI